MSEPKRCVMCADGTLEPHPGVNRCASCGETYWRLDIVTQSERDAALGRWLRGKWRLNVDAGGDWCLTVKVDSNEVVLIPWQPGPVPSTVDEAVARMTEGK